jgi:hypothetical protein
MKSTREAQKMRLAQLLAVAAAVGVHFIVCGVVIGLGVVGFCRGQSRSGSANWN